MGVNLHNKTVNMMRVKSILNRGSQQSEELLSQIEDGGSIPSAAILNRPSTELEKTALSDAMPMLQKMVSTHQHKVSFKGGSINSTSISFQTLDCKAHGYTGKDQHLIKLRDAVKEFITGEVYEKH